MEIDKPYLFIEVGQKKLIFFIVEYNEELDFKVLDSLIVKTEGVTNKKISNIELFSKNIKENLDLIEKKINFTFRNATVINNLDDYKCINVSGFKKLGGSQISNEDISYILNDIKKIVMDNEK
jgi:cell division ATPase FtsA